jgi:hypothetical protein
MSILKCAKCGAALTPNCTDSFCEDCAQLIKDMTATEVFTPHLHSLHNPLDMTFVQKAFPQLEIISRLGDGGRSGVP